MESKEGNIIWLASYPKSGNTWLRIFLNNLLSESDEPVDINALHETGSISSARGIFDELVGVDSADLTRDEIDFYLPKAHLLRSQQLTEKQFVKTHDAFTRNKAGQWIIPFEATYKVIYLIRNPLDVCVSFAHHSGHTGFDKIIKQMSNSNLVLSQSKKKYNNQLQQYMGSWSGHVNSWMKNIPLENILLVKYEDMKLKPLTTFTEIVKFLGLDYNNEEILKAIDKSSIDKLKKMEEENGFREKKQQAKRFFRKGVIGNWKEELSKIQIATIINEHEKMMMEYGYLCSRGKLKV